MMQGIFRWCSMFVLCCIISCDKPAEDGSANAVLPPDVSQKEDASMSDNGEKYAKKHDIASKEQAIEIAKEKVHAPGSGIRVPKDAEVVVTVENSKYVITFCLPPPKSITERRAAYYARVIIDSKTGKVLQMLVGS